MRLFVVIVLVIGAEAVALRCNADGVPALDRAVREWSNETAVPAYQYALVDLNDDGALDAVVLVTDGRFCGSGGCSMIVFRGSGGGFKVVSSSTITRKPIWILPETRYKWHTLAVSVAGGDATSGQVLMRFNGTRYPLNPSVQPYAKPGQLVSAKALIK